MEYEKTILELLERVATLEVKVADLEGNLTNIGEKPARGTYTEMVVIINNNRKSKGARFKQHNLNFWRLTKRRRFKKSFASCLQRNEKMYER